MYQGRRYVYSGEGAVSTRSRSIVTAYGNCRASYLVRSKLLLLLLFSGSNLVDMSSFHGGKWRYSTVARTRLEAVVFSLS